MRVRMGVHTGEASERDGDYFGPAVNRAARLMNAGHGGQVLVGATTAAVVVGGAALVDLGEHRLRDLAEPQRVFQWGPTVILVILCSTCCFSGAKYGGVKDGAFSPEPG